MFTTYIKSLNDMVFSTSEEPEEQPNTGVLGRIGSWFSPWRAKGPKSPTENAFPASCQAVKSDGGEGSGEPVRPEAREQQWEEREQSSGTNRLGLSRGVFLREDEDATQSARREGSLVSSRSKPGEGGPKEEEFIVCKKKRTGQGKEGSNGASASGNPEKNASHLTHLSSSFEQGVAWNSDQASAQPQGETGRRLHVYLEETSVVHRGPDTYTGQEVVHTKVKKSLQVIPKAKSSQGFDSSAAENKTPNVRPAVGSQSYSAQVGVPLKSHKDWQLELEPDKEQTEAGSMGRKNTARRKYRKNSQGDGGSSPSEKTPAPEGFPAADNSVTSPQSKSPKTHMGESSGDSSSKPSPTSPASPGGGERRTTCPDAIAHFENFQDRHCVADGNTVMEDDDSLYKVERKTETPESKRRSIKVSRSEVKLFTKYVPLKAEQSPAGDDLDPKSTLKKTKTEEKDIPNTETDARRQDLLKTDEESEPAIGRIADKISLFERQTLGSLSKNFQTPRSADVSPVRKPTGRLKADLLLSDQRSRSAERYGTARSSSASPSRETPLTIKERVRNFTEASKTDCKAALPETYTMTGMSQKSTTCVMAAAAKSPELDSQGKLDTKEHIKTTAVSEITSKPDGRDTTAVRAKTAIPEEQHTGSKNEDTGILKAADQGTKHGSTEADVTTKGTGDSAELTNSMIPQYKGLSRTGPRSKRRKSREPTSPISPNRDKKPDHFANKQGVTATKKQVDHKIFPSDKIDRSLSDVQSPSDTKQQEFKKELEVLDKRKKQSADITKTVNRQEGLPEPSVSKDELDTGVSSRRTTTPIDEVPVILPQKEAKEKEARGSLSLIQETKDAPKDDKEMLFSPSAKHHIEKMPSMEHAKVDKKSSLHTETKTKVKARQPGKKDAGQDQNNGTELINHEKAERPEGKKTHQTERKDNPEQPLPSDKNTTKGKASHSGKGILGTEGNVAWDDTRKNAERNEETGPVRDITKTDASRPEPASEKVGVSAETLTQTRHQSVSQAAAKQLEKSNIAAVTQTDEAVSNRATGGSYKGEIAAEVSGLRIKSAESPGTETEPAVTAAQPQPDYVSVEKAKNSVDDSQTHGARGADFPSSKPFTKTAAAVEEATVNVTDDTPVLIAAQVDNIASAAASAHISVSESVNSQGAAQDGGSQRSADKLVASKVKVVGETSKTAPTQSKEAKNTSGTSAVASLKGAQNIPQSPSDTVAARATVAAMKRTDEKVFNLPVTDHSFTANGDFSLPPQLNKVKTEPSQTLKSPTLPKANKLIPDLLQQSSMRKFNFPRGLSKDDSAARQDAPSSWLDVDFPQQKLRVTGMKLSSSGSESNLLDTSDELDDDNFIEKIQKLCAPFSLPPRKHNHLRPPQPPFALPAIKEDRFEKTFDPEEFTFGLRKKNQFSFDSTPSFLAKFQNAEPKPGLKPARASLADRCLLLNSLDTQSRLKDMTSAVNEEDVKGEKDDHIKVKSRLEGSCVLSSLTSSSFRGKRNGVCSEGTSSEDVPPSSGPQLSPPPLSQPPPSSPTAAARLKDTLAKQSPALSSREEARAVEAVVSDSGPPFPSFNDIKLPDYLEKYLPREPAKPAQSMQGQEQIRREGIEKMVGPGPVGDAHLVVKTGQTVPDGAPPCFPGVPPTIHPPILECQQPPAHPPEILRNDIRTTKGFHKRPGKMVLFEKAQFSGQVYDIHGDVADATAMQLSPVISVKVVRGCWVLYEKPGFQGRCIALEEGGTELTNLWAESEMQATPVLIGSIRLAVCDYSIPHIDLFTEPDGHGRVTPYHDDTIETGSFGIPLSTASIQVHSGVWLVFSDPGFQGMLAVLEAGVYPFPETWGFPSPFVGSLRPLKMGGFKVENPSEVKAVVYELPGFEGSCLEIDGDIFSFCESEEDFAPDPVSKKLKPAGSLKIIGGLWVGYSQPGFEGQQFILEEGEYRDCNDWGGSGQFLSLRPVLFDCMSPRLKMFSNKNFCELGVNIDLTGPVINMDDTGYGMKTQSIDVISGVWVVFEEPGFCGESYILEKGLYGSPEDWGALQARVASAMPVVLEHFENAAKFKVQLFSDPGFQGSVLPLEDNMASLQDGFTVGSCKVLAGSWLAFEGHDFTGRMYVLEEGSYPDLRAMGCASATASILSLQTTGFEFSLPSITLFERCGLRGKRVVLTDASVNLQLAGGCGRVQSVLVEGGMWILYEGINYRGAQIFLKPGEVPDWNQLSSWRKIGSLRPLLQKQVHFRLRNRQTGLMMSVTGDLDDVKLLRVQETEETDGFEQMWLYKNGYLHCKLLDECCLSPSGSVIIAGSRIGLTPEQGNHLWNITPEGFIHYTPTSDLVLDVKGGHHYDKNQVILNTLDPNKEQQRWDLEVI